MATKDTVFYKPREQIQPFQFDEQVADVFEDMISRSVPGYRELVHQIANLAVHVMKPNSNIFDLGTSLGAVTMAIRSRLNDKSIQVIAVDASAAMIKRCSSLLHAYHSEVPVTLIEDDVMNVTIENANLVILNFTLQFIPIELRVKLLKRIYEGLNTGGALVLSEKIDLSNDRTNDLIKNMHENFKRSQGYSELEISQKRDALQNVLIPETLKTHANRLTSVGFSDFDIWYQQYNFTSFLAIK